MRNSLNALVFTRPTHNAYLFEFGLRERHALMVESTQAEPTIYRRCRDAGYPLDTATKRAADRNEPRKESRRQVKTQPRVFIEA